MKRPAPPRQAERLLGWIVGRGERADGLLGDLHEEFVRHAARGPSRATAWYWVHALRLSARFGTQAMVAQLRPTSTPRLHTVNRRDSIMRTIGIEARYALRSLLKRPALTGLVLLTLALGLGANATIFANIDALLIRPFPFADVDRIAVVAEALPSESVQQRESTAPANFLDWRKEASTFEYLAAFEWWDVSLIGLDEPERVQGFFVSPDFFRVLGVQPAMGRGFNPEDETRGQHRRAVLGHGVWQRRFGGDPAIVGKTVRLDGEPFEVIGVAPAGFDFPLGAEVWAPLAFTPERATLRTARFLTVIGRLANGRQLSDARAQMAVIGERLRQQYPEANRDRAVRVMTLTQGMIDAGIGPILSLWQASAIFVLLIACANVASLLLARGAERQRDIAVRLAMGASRSRIVRELLLESAWLGLLAVPGALLVAWLGVTVLRSSMPAKVIRFVPGWGGIDIDSRLILVTTTMALLTAVVFGLAPALSAARPRLADTLKDGGRAATTGRRPQRMRRALVIAEITLALPLLVASGMGASGAYRFLNGPQGYDPAGVLSMSTVLPDAQYAEPGPRRTFTDAVLDRLRAIPGTQAVAAVNTRPAGGANTTRSIEIDGQPNPDATRPPEADFRAATPDLFTVLRIPILRGRGFVPLDREGTQPVAIVSQSFARRHWSDASPIGRRIRLSGSGPWLTIVGVAGDVIHDWFGRRDYPTVYAPYAQHPTGNLVILVRASGNPGALAAPARAAVRAVDPSQPVFDVMTMREALEERTVGLQFIAGVMGVFGVLALLLAAVGVYSVMAYFTTQRTHEIGVRMALGATPGDVLRLTVGQTGRLTIVGVLLGVMLSVVAGRLVEAGLLGSASTDIRMISGFAGILVVAALAAGYIPARRAAAIDPISALRE